MSSNVSMRCESPAETARRTAVTLAGSDDAHLDAVLFNCAVRLYLGGGAASIEAGIGLAREIIFTGRAMAKLRGLR